MTTRLVEMIATLKQERQGLDEAIITLERLAARSGNARKGRPPAWMTAARKAAEANASPTSTNNKTTRKPRTFTAAQRAAQAKRMKAYWTKKRKEAAA